MYVPEFNAVDDEAEVRAMVASTGSAEFVTVGPAGRPMATLLPIIWQGSTVIAHMARANPQWRHIAPDAAVLLICAGPQAYVSPSWYAAKAEHGRVVPTWNYTAVHLSGTVRVHDDVEWLRRAVTELTDQHERGRTAPWQVTDAPSPYINGQLRGIVGLEVNVQVVEGKAKLSQNRSDADRRGVVAGLAEEGGMGSPTIARQMTDALSPDGTPT
jgi:transcriptional regulator